MDATTNNIENLKCFTEICLNIKLTYCHGNAMAHLPLCFLNEVFNSCLKVINSLVIQ